MKQGPKFIQGLRLMGFSSTLIWYYLHKQNKEQTDKHISYIYIYNTSIKTNLATDEGNSRNEICHWTNNETDIAVQSCFWLRVEFMA